MDLTWIKQHKMVVALFGAATAGFVLYSFLHKSSSAGAAAPVVGGMSLGDPGNAIGAGAPQYLVPVVQTSTAPNATATTPVSNTPAPNLPAVVPVAAPTPATTTAAVIAANPYGVGMKVTSAESITQSVYDPLYNSWVDLTSKGGIYTSAGTAISGSGYNPAWNGSGRLALASGGAQVQEFNPAGALVGTYTVEHGH